MKTLADTSCKKRAGEWESGGAGERDKKRLSASPPLRLFISCSPALQLSLSLCLPGFLAAGGKVGPPLPPERREQLVVKDLSVEQRGAHLILSLPFTRTPKTQLQRIDVYRLVEPIEAPMGVA